MLVLLVLMSQSPIIITEVMSNVKGSESGPGDRNEYIEIYNTSEDTVDVSAFWITDFDGSDSICIWEDTILLAQYPGVRIHSAVLYPYSYALILDPEYTSNDTTGGYVQPYEFPDSTLILTIDDTSIGGSGLASNDPLLLYSNALGCSTTFGTPFDSLDNFPCDPGDGISWERIDFDLSDEPSNWHPSINSAGCTPGQENSTCDAYDLAINDSAIYFIPAKVNAGNNVTFEMVIFNNGLWSTQDYQVRIYDDPDMDSCMSDNKLIALIDGAMVEGLDSTSVLYEYTQPAQGIHNMIFNIEYEIDKDLTNNTVYKTLVVVGATARLALTPRVFSPNNDGIDDRLQINYQVPEPGGMLSILLFDARGCLRHRLCDKAECFTSQGTVYWDGTAGNSAIQSGMYVVYLEYRIHNEITKAKKTTVLAR
jgi:hypothetical protein